jgi:hypothetical protein
MRSERNCESPDPVAAQSLIWNGFLKFLLPRSESYWDESHETRIEYSSGTLNLLLFIDEVPEDPVGVHKLGLMRDCLRLLKYVRVFLSGTN